MTRRWFFFATLGMSAIAVLLSGCPTAEKKPTSQTPPKQATTTEVKPQPAQETKKPTQEAEKTVAKPKSSEKDLAEELEEAAEKPRDLGPPLVDDSAELVRLHEKQPVWVDRKNKHVVLQGEVCRAGYPLEFFATYSNRSYEAVVSVNVTPWIVHTGLLSVGAAQFEPKFVPPTGTEVAIEVRWKDPNGKMQSTPAQNWIRNIKTKKALDSNWVFAGSLIVTDETTGKKFYQADSGELICVLSLPTAMLDLPILSYGPLDARLFEAFEENLPPPGTPITILLKPILSKSGAKPAEKPAISPEKAAAMEQKAVETADPWLALVDGGQYSRSWDSTADYFKLMVGRKDFINVLNETRKPLGEVKSRVLQSKQYRPSLPGAPDGHYVVMQYKTSFAKGKPVIETVTPMLDKDKKWRVSGYYIK
jgi:hypothetical protein